MTVSKILLTALGGCLSVIVLLLGAWGKDVSNRQDSMDHRLATTEQHYAAIDGQLQGIRDRLDEMKDLLEDQEAHRAR